MEQAKNYLFGGLAGCMATVIIQPLDLIKTRLQLNGELGSAKMHNGTIQAISNIFKNEGFFNMYKGLSAALMRQITYTTIRMGTYKVTLEKFEKNEHLKGFKAKLLAGMIGGGFGSIAGNPADLVLNRMTSDGRLEVSKRRNYKNVFEALMRITREEGVYTLWRGCSPTIARAIVLNAAQLGCYSQSKEMILNTGFLSDGILVQTMASFVAGFFATCVSLPIDILKTRIQTMKDQTYKSPLDCLKKTIQVEGVLSLWKGFSPYFLRLGPQTVFTWIFMEQLYRLFP
eukprot:TRINITY_DN12257_c0_g1_i1.p1 TRINITY_DN12257_c0_g1~~TRINITY_DN12257_c0_g1_i1.p1  ORF type:complete len:286 (+),score=75.50 TRINITY_DN12257_c0_g1_i1:34-891(+)